jgi:hypothetical protein
MEDQDSSREDNMEEVAEVVPISKEKSPWEKDLDPQGRREKFKNKDKPNPFKKAWRCQQVQVQV